MKKYTSLFFLLLCIHCFAQDSFQLARPLAKYESIFFKDSAKLELKFAQPGAKIYYTVDNDMLSENSDEPTENSILYKKPILLRKQFTTIKAKVFCNGFLPSETVEYSFAKEGKKIKRITATAPNPKYPGSGDNTLFDNKGGVENISSKTWMGFNNDTISFTIELAKPEKISTILLSFLQNESSWIFLPELILAYYYDETKKIYYPLAREVIFNERESPAGCNMRLLFPKKDDIITTKIFLDIFPVKKIPDWHPAKGQHAWCFIDEIKVY